MARVFTSRAVNWRDPASPCEALALEYQSGSSSLRVVKQLPPQNVMPLAHSSLSPLDRWSLLYAGALPQPPEAPDRRASKLTEGEPAVGDFGTWATDQSLAALHGVFARSEQNPV